MTAHLLTSQLESGAPCTTEMSRTRTEIKNHMRSKEDPNKGVLSHISMLLINIEARTFTTG